MGEALITRRGGGSTPYTTVQAQFNSMSGQVIGFMAPDMSRCDIFAMLSGVVHVYYSEWYYFTSVSFTKTPNHGIVCQVSSMTAWSESQMVANIGIYNVSNYLFDYPYGCKYNSVSPAPVCVNTFEVDLYLS